jgi:hypothetical protein
MLELRFPKTSREAGGLDVYILTIFEFRNGDFGELIEGKEKR